MNETNPTSESQSSPVRSPAASSSGSAAAVRRQSAHGPTWIGSSARRIFGRSSSMGPGGPGAARRGGRPMMRRKVCRFCAEKIAEVDYKAIPICAAF
jgi:hypothetical protein